MKLNKRNLKRRMHHLVPINLNFIEDVEDNHEIYIFQHPHGGPVASSSSPCRIVSKFGIRTYR